MQSSHSPERSLPGSVPLQVEQDDTQLVQASQQGDQDAFASLVQRYQRRVFTLSVHLVLDDNAASERTQEAFLAAWQRLPSFRSEVSFSTWLYRITVDFCVQQMERHTHEDVQHANKQQEQRQEGTNPEQEDETIVREQLAQLPSRYRAVLILRHFNDRTYEEMAYILRLPVGTVKTHLFRARRLLSECVLAQHLVVRGTGS